MNTNVNSEICQIFNDWQVDHQQLADSIDEIRDWMLEVNQLGIPHFGETASRLQPFRARLQSHFDREDRILNKLAEIYSKSTPEIEAFTRQTKSDHQSLMMRLDIFSMTSYGMRHQSAVMPSTLVTALRAMV